MTTTRLSGHTLAYQGAPYRYGANGFGSRCWQRIGGSGEGKGLCSCGEASSKLLPSNNARKAWHREHKAEIAALRDRFADHALVAEMGKITADQHRDLVRAELERPDLGKGAKAEIRRRLADLADL